MTLTLQAQLVDAAIALPAARVAMRPGKVAAAAWDEDAVTLGAGAGLELLDRSGIRPAALITATVTAPLIEPGIAPFLAEVLDLQTGSGRQTIVAEHGGSTAAGGAALAHALALVAAGIAPVLMIAADTRRDSGDRPIGDAAVAVLLGAAGDGGTVEYVGSEAELFLDRWRTGNGGVTVGDRSLDRLGPDRTVGDRYSGATVVAGPTGPHVERVGHAGCAHLAVLMLTGAAENALYAVSAGGITHVLAFTRGDGFAVIAERTAAVIARGTETPPDTSSMEGFQPFVSHAMNRRERAATYRLEGARDEQTGEVVYPSPPAQAAATMSPHRLSRIGIVHTFARDHVFPVGGPLTMAIVDLEGGGRFYAQVADGAEVQIGDRVRLVLRRVHTGDGVPHYFWKAIKDEEAA